MLFNVLLRLVAFLVFVHTLFFFQAEDGIRDVAVTGVQTCALPILKYQRAGVGSTLTLWSFGSSSTERTRKMCWPSARPEARYGFSHSPNASPSTAHSNEIGRASCRERV